jgi:hypothetical protein
MRRPCLVLLGFLTGLALSAPTWAASEQAMKLRNQSALSGYSPSEAFLSGNFVADEIEPGFIFGKVKDFVKARSCPTSWLIEEGEKKRIEGKDRQANPLEYSVYLEEDCPGKVTYYVFVDGSHTDVAQWMQWRQQFHGRSKTEPLYGAAKTGLEQAAQNGFPVVAELRFLEVNGELSLKRPEEILMGELKFQPLYDLKQGKAISR